MQTDPNYVAQLYAMKQGLERELEALGYGEKQPSVPVGIHTFDRPLTITVNATVERGEGLGEGKELFTPTPRGLNLNSMCLALHRNGFNAENTATIIGDSIRASAAGEVDKAMDAIMPVVEERREMILAELRSAKDYRFTRAKIAPHRGCFLTIQ